MTDYLHNAKKHFITITTHRIEVRKLCFKIGLYRQGILHDLSKYSPTEFLVGCKYYQGYRSPNDSEREDKGYSSAWLHHMKNKHHYEYWIDYSLDRTKTMEGVDMPWNYVCEMVCDRIAAAKIYYGDGYSDSYPLEYLQKGRTARIAHKNVYRKLTYILTMLSEKGEEYTLSYLRAYVKKKRKEEIKKLILRK